MWLAAVTQWPLLNGSASSAAAAASPWQPLIDVSCEPLAYEVGILIAREQLRIKDVIGQGLADLFYPFPSCVVKLMVMKTCFCVVRFTYGHPISILTRLNLE